MENRLNYDPTLFKGTAQYYASYRFPYPEELFHHLAEVFHLDETSQALDLGCGTGNLSIPLAKYCRKVVCMDPDQEMLDEAKRVASLKQVENLNFVLGSSWDLTNEMETFQVTIMGESFHWMDRDTVLDLLYDLIVPGGGVAIISKKQVGPAGYQEMVDNTIKKFLGEKRRAGKSFYFHPTERHEVVLARSKFALLEPWHYEYQVERTMEEMIGFLYSTSYANKRLLGDQAENFENELKQKLLSLDDSGVFQFQVVATALMGVKK